MPAMCRFPLAALVTLITLPSDHALHLGTCTCRSSSKPMWQVHLTSACFLISFYFSPCGFYRIKLGKAVQPESTGPVRKSHATSQLVEMGIQHTESTAPAQPCSSTVPLLAQVTVAVLSPAGGSPGGCFHLPPWCLPPAMSSRVCRPPREPRCCVRPW